MLGQTQFIYCFSGFSETQFRGSRDQKKKFKKLKIGKDLNENANILEKLFILKIFSVSWIFPNSFLNDNKERSEKQQIN